MYLFVSAKSCAFFRLLGNACVILSGLGLLAAHYDKAFLSHQDIAWFLVVEVPARFLFRVRCAKCGRPMKYYRNWHSERGFFGLCFACLKCGEYVDSGVVFGGGEGGG